MIVETVEKVSAGPPSLRHAPYKVPSVPVC